MRNKITDNYQSGMAYKTISKVLVLRWNTLRAIIQKWRNQNSEPSQEWLAYQKLLQKQIVTHPQGQKDNQEQHSQHQQGPRLPQLKSVFIIQQ